MSDTRGLGDLGRLPAEIRSVIWKYTTPGCSSFNKTEESASLQADDTRLAFLRTSQQVYWELSHVVYKNLVLYFQIVPMYQPEIWLVASTNTGLQLQLRDVGDATRQGFRKLPYEKLKGVHIDIQAPAQGNPGQVLCLWRKCLDLQRLLRGRTNKAAFSHLQIHFANSDTAKWCANMQPNRTIVLDELEGTDDYYVVLIALRMIRRVRTVTVSLPQDLKSTLDATSLDLVKGTENDLTEEYTPRSPSEPKDIGNDDDLQDEQYEFF